MAENNDANESVINGVNGDTNTSSEVFDDTDFPPLKSPTTPFADTDSLHKKIASLERENEDSESRIRELKTELAKLRVEKEAETERCESEKKAAEAIANHASKLETDVVRLQEENITAVHAYTEANKEIQELNVKISDLKKEKAVVEGKVKEMELKMEELIKKSQENEGLIGGLMVKIAEQEAAAVATVVEREGNGELVVEEDGVNDDGGDGWKGLLMEKLPVIGMVSVGVVIVGGVMCYVRSSRN